MCQEVLSRIGREKATKKCMVVSKWLELGNLSEGQNQKMLFVTEVSAHESAMRWEGLGSAFLKRVLFLKFSFPSKFLFLQRNETILI